jgi:hypothetical protein
MVLDNTKFLIPARTQTLDHSACGKSLHWLHYSNSLALKFINQIEHKHCLVSTWVAMRIVASFMTTDVSKLVYCRSFHSIMSYGLIFTGDSIEWKRLFTTQKKVIRIMSKALERKLSESLFKPFSKPPTCQWTYTIITVSLKEYVEIDKNTIHT